MSIEPNDFEVTEHGTVRLEFVTNAQIATFRGRSLVALSLTTQVSPEDPTETKFQCVMDPQQAISIGSQLQAVGLEQLQKV